MTAGRDPSSAPPRWAGRLLEWTSPADEGEAAAGDLDEEYLHHIAPSRGRRAAHRWYWWQVLRSIPGFARRRVMGVQRDRSHRPRKGAGVMEAIAQDLRYAFRRLAGRPGLAVAAILTVALGIGINSAIFGLVYGVVLDRLPFAEAERLVRLVPDSLLPFEKSDVLAIEERVSAFAEVAGWGRGLYLLTGGEEPEEVRGARVFANHFSMLGAEPLVGRWFLPDDGAPGAPPVAILSHGLWNRRFGGDHDLIGDAVQIDGEAVTVVGVMPRGHQPMESDWQLWTPMSRDPREDQGSGLAVNARLEEGVTVEQATAALRSAAREYAASRGHEMPQEELDAMRVAPLRSWILGEIDRPLLVLLAAALLVLLIACANVANLLLALTHSRASDLAVRSALGADGRRLARMVLLEGTILAVGGGALGVLGASWALGWASGHLPAQLPRAHNVSIDAAVVAFAVALVTLSLTLFATAPALRAGSRSLARPSGRRAPGERAGSGIAPRTLVAIQMAMAVVLVVSSMLMLRSLAAMTAIDPGFESDGVVVVRPSPPSQRYRNDAERIAYYERVLEAVADRAEVSSVGAIQFLPMTPGGWWSSFATTARPLDEGVTPPRLSMRVTTPGYFKTLGIPLLAGRDFTSADDAQAPRRVIVNSALAQAAWPGVEPVGREILLTGEEVAHEIIGVVGDVRQRDLLTPSTPEAYVSFSRVPWSRMWIGAKVSGSSEAGLAAVRSAVRSVDGQVAITGSASLRDIVGRTYADVRFFAAALSAGGLLALLLSAVGIYGVTSYAVSREMHQIGVRLALGARPRRVLLMTLWRGLVPVLAGGGVGVVASLAATRILESQLYEVSAADPATLVLVPLSLALVGAAALWHPSLAASRADPIAVLRDP